MSTRRKPDLPESLRETVLAMRRQARRVLAGFDLSSRRHQDRRDMPRSEIRRKAIEDDADGG
jgi:hypothetical protein